GLHHAADDQIKQDGVDVVGEGEGRDLVGGTPEVGGHLLSDEAEDPAQDGADHDDRGGFGDALAIRRSRRDLLLRAHHGYRSRASDISRMRRTISVVERPGTRGTVRTSPPYPRTTAASGRGCFPARSSASSIA